VNLLSVDAETNGLLGQPFAVGAVKTTDQDDGMVQVYYARCPIEGSVDPWVAEHVLPGLPDPVTMPDYRSLLADFARWYDRHSPDTAVIAHVAWPVEAGLLRDMLTMLERDPFSGPFPLHEVATLLLAAGHIPSSVDDYNTAHGLSVGSAFIKMSAHHPLYDARAAEVCARHLLGGRA
jgi:hypothetical protein